MEGSAEIFQRHTVVNVEHGKLLFSIVVGNVREVKKQVEGNVGGRLVRPVTSPRP